MLYRILLILAVMLASMPFSVAANEPSVAFLVRHAEKMLEGKDPELSEAGEVRAGQLASLLKDAGINRIYSTDFKRTRHTAAPLAKHLGLEVEIYHWKALDDLVAKLSEPGARSLVVGHSNTTPELAALLGGESGGEIDEKSEYDRLYIITIAEPGGVSSLLLRY